MNWVTVKKFSELVGYTEDAVRCKIKKGVWLKDRQWIKGPDGRILINVSGVQAWIEGRRA